MSNKYVPIASAPQSASAARYSEDVCGDVMDDSITVFDEVQEPIWTGLVDQHGVDLYRVTDRLPMGFRVKS